MSRSGGQCAGVRVRRSRSRGQGAEVSACGSESRGQGHRSVRAARGGARRSRSRSQGVEIRVRRSGHGGQCAGVRARRSGCRGRHPTVLAEACSHVPTLHSSPADAALGSSPRCPGGGPTGPSLCPAWGQLHCCSPKAPAFPGALGGQGCVSGSTLDPRGRGRSWRLSQTGHSVWAPHQGEQKTAPPAPE